MARYDVARFYVDPRHWETQADQWAATWGDDVVVTWPTNQIGRMHDALVRFLEDTAERDTTHDGDETVQLPAPAARKAATPGDRDIPGQPSETPKTDMRRPDQ